MAHAYKLPSLDSFPTLSTDDKTHILDLLFEPSIPLHTLALPLFTQAEYETYPDFIATVCTSMSTLADSSSTSDSQWLNDILSAHPRLGAKKVDSAQSAAEQAQLKGSEDESRKLAEFNARYEEKFPGLRYVVFVDGRSRDVIMQDMQRRIESSTFEQERGDAIRAMGEIAADRASKLL